MVPLHFRALLLTASLGIVASSAAGQVAAENDPFGPPRNPLTCERVPHDSIPSGLGYGYRFSDGRAMVDDRDIEVVYDEDGRPWSLTLVVTDPPGDGTLSLSSYIVRFERDSSGAGALLRWTTNLDGTPAAGADSTGVRSDLVELGESELRRAREFAEHLWSIRCGRR